MIRKNIYQALKERILVLDGGLGTMVQGFNLEEKDYRGDEFASWPSPLKGCNDLLVLTAPHVIGKIHEAYFKAGADIVSTDTFNANVISMADYGLQERVYDINLAAARLARGVADAITESNPSKPRWVAGSVGPTSRTASMSAEVNNPASREVTFDALAKAYQEQMRGLLDGGVDLLLIETVFDTLNAKAAIFALEAERQRRGHDIPVIVSGTLADASGRTLSGQVVEAFYASIAHARPLAVGFNCAYGARQLEPYLERLAAVCEFPISTHPNAGLPNLMGGYDETPAMMAADVESYMRKDLVNIIGGCCGTTPAHIAAIAETALRYKPRPVPVASHVTVLSGLEPLRIEKGNNFVNVGERTNVAGSAKFARLIRENNLDEAIGIARSQVEAGAQIVDVCMDDGLIDGPAAMTSFLNLAMSEPEIARVPFMIDSSSWETIEAGLKCVQGKSVVNSISLKEGEQEFLRRARVVHSYGAAVVVMLFDETGQADTYARKTEVAERAYNLLVGDGFAPEDIIFDPNVLSVATGMEEHDNYGVDFIEAVRWIKQNLPYAKISGGISNLSFAYRGNNTVREAMHSVFLFHAIEAGLDMGIVNPGMLQVYSEIEPELLELAEDVVLNRRPDATERLSAYAEKVKGNATAASKSSSEQWRESSLERRIGYAMTKGVTDYIEPDILEAYSIAGTPLAVIDNYLMPVMENIGVLFGEGKMFLPQVVKSARVMKRAVDVLTPYIEAQKETDGGTGYDIPDESASVGIPLAGGSSNGVSPSAMKILIATVKGDVHDIGKNIVSVVMACNGYQVKDLGVMVECADIVRSAKEWGAEAIGLSGLISPSLNEMIKVASELEKEGMSVPLIIGGATTSELHTAVKIAPVYEGGVVIHSRDASENVAILSKLSGSGRVQYISELKERQQMLREKYEGRDTSTRLSLADARENRFVKDPASVVVPKQKGIFRFDAVPVAEVIPYIDWNFFFPAWQIRGSFPDILESPVKGEEASKLYRDALQMLDAIANRNLLTLNGVAGIFEATSDGDDIMLSVQECGTDCNRDIRLAQLRNQQKQESGANMSLADFVVKQGDGEDYIGLFAVTAGIGLDELADKYRSSGDDYSAIMAKLLADRLTEAFGEYLHAWIRREAWGYEARGEQTMQDIHKGRYEGVRVAYGYPACPDHSQKREVLALLDPQGTTGMTLTESYMIQPGEALCGMIFGPGSRFFSVGTIGEDQLVDYAARRGMSVEEMRRMLVRHLD